MRICVQTISVSVCCSMCSIIFFCAVLFLPLFFLMRYSTLTIVAEFDFVSVIVHNPSLSCVSVLVFVVFVVLADVVLVHAVTSSLSLSIGARVLFSCAVSFSLSLLFSLLCRVLHSSHSVCERRHAVRLPIAYVMILLHLNKYLLMVLLRPLPLLLLWSSGAFFHIIWKRLFQFSIPPHNFYTIRMPCDRSIGRSVCCSADRLLVRPIIRSRSHTLFHTSLFAYMRYTAQNVRFSTRKKRVHNSNRVIVFQSASIMIICISTWRAYMHFKYVSCRELTLNNKNRKEIEKFASLTFLQRWKIKVVRFIDTLNVYHLPFFIDEAIIILLIIFWIE